MDKIFKWIGFGVGRPNNEKVEHEVIEKIFKADFRPQHKMVQLAQSQLGTVGSGNHFVDLFRDDEGWLWIGVHFGSRGFGHKTAMGFIALSQGLGFDERGKEGAMDAPPILFDLNSELGQDYIAAMSLAGDYAHAGRDTVVNKVFFSRRRRHNGPAFSGFMTTGAVERAKDACDPARRLNRSSTGRNGS